MINQENMKHIAQLARLKFSEEDLKDLENDLGLILKYIDQLKQVDITRVELGEEAEEKHLRQDIVMPSLSSREKLLSLTPSQREQYISVKSVFKKKS